jgi:hypothetical protein
MSSLLDHLACAGRIAASLFENRPPGVGADQTKQGSLLRGRFLVRQISRSMDEGLGTGSMSSDDYWRRYLLPHLFSSMLVFCATELRAAIFAADDMAV